jgi:hypothetical protein
VWLLNDNMNTRARVSAVLEKVAGLSAKDAEKVMMQAHTTGPYAEKVLSILISKSKYTRALTFENFCTRQDRD